MYQQYKENICNRAFKCGSELPEYVALILRNGGSQSPDRWLRELRNNHSPDPKHIILHPNMESVLKRDYSEELYNIRKGWDDDIPTDLKLVLGPLACGAAVVGNSEIVDDMIKQHSRKTVGLDMESYGMFYATNYGLDSGTIPICLKSISDFADEKKGDGYQKYAAYTSAGFARYLIESVLPYING